MGNSKIVMISGIYLILGMYTLSFQTSETTHSESVIAVANSTKADGLAKTGISLALAKMGTNAALHTYSEEQRSVDGGILAFSATQPDGFSSTQTKVTSTAIVHDDTVKVVAIFTYDRGRWRITRSFLHPST